MYLATLDGGITQDVVTRLNNNSVRLAVPKEMKDTLYKDYNSVISFEKLFAAAITINNQWQPSTLNNDEKKEIRGRFEYQKNKHKNNVFIVNYYDRQIAKFN